MPEPVTPAPLGVRGALRWTWRQLTSMRVALMLLMLLAVVAVPGSLLPQRPQDAGAVARYLEGNPDLGPWLDRFGFFDVYGSVWFSAVYLLLFVSLVGCILPRVAAHARAWRARPPRAPRRFTRFPARAAGRTEASAQDVVDAAVRVLRAGRRFRVEVGHEPGATTVSAERGYLRETGNIVFHLALVGLLVAVATGQLLHYRGQAIVVTGKSFANVPSAYDTFETGSAVDPADLVPFTLRLDEFTARFDAAGRPSFFQADVTLTEPGSAPRAESIRVNRPLAAGGANVYLAGNGYAPELTVRDSDGEVAFAGTVPFLPQDASYRSRGVVKVPDVTSGDQIGLVGFLLPTAVITEDAAFSAYPQPGNPVLVLQVWRGDLGLDTGIPQDAYQLDTAGMAQVTEPDGTPTTLVIPLGEQVDLPGGLGTVSFDALPRFIAVDLRHDPSLGWVAGFSGAALLGLATSLFTPRRRVWLRVRDDAAPGPAAAGPGGDLGSSGTGTARTVEVAALARSEDGGLIGEVERVIDAIRQLGSWTPDDGPARGAEGVDEPR